MFITAFQSGYSGLAKKLPAPLLTFGIIVPDSVCSHGGPLEIRGLNELDGPNSICRTGLQILLVML